MVDPGRVATCGIKKGAGKHSSKGGHVSEGMQRNSDEHVHTWRVQ